MNVTLYTIIMQDRKTGETHDFKKAFPIEKCNALIVSLLQADYELYKEFPYTYIPKIVPLETKEN